MDLFSRLLMPIIKECNMPIVKHGDKAASASTSLLLRAGFSSSGMYSILPLGLRVLESVQKIIDEEMQRISSFKCSLPSLQPTGLWEQTGRLEAMKDSMFVLREEDGLVLAPTHEEEVTRLIAQHVSSASKLPLRLYQIGPKFRKEQRPRAGLLRLREFLMKDMYSFDKSLEEARATYEEVRGAYDRIFRRLGINVVAVEASCGDMGGSMSHEYHLVAEAGEDSLFICKSCNTGLNHEVMHQRSQNCPACDSALQQVSGIELGHTFMLGQKYTKALGASIKDTAGNSVPMEMGCYGIGVSRLVAAIAEATHDRLGLRWPASVSPYQIILTGGQVMSPDMIGTLKTFRERLNSAIGQSGTIAIDDRADLSLGWRLKDASLIGVPFTVVFGKDFAAKGLVEVYRRRHNGTDRTDVHAGEITDFFQKFMTQPM